MTDIAEVTKRFWEKVEVAGADECWLWTAGAGSHGYGEFYPYRGCQELAHRFVLKLTVGQPSIEKPHALHGPKCTSKRCVNPAHLRWGSHAENMSDAGVAGRMNRPRRTTCPHGHAMTPENTIVKAKRWKSRVYEEHACRECNRIYLANRRNRKKKES